MFTEFEKTSIQIKQNPIIFQTVGQQSSNFSEDFAKAGRPVLHFLFLGKMMFNDRNIVFTQPGPQLELPS